MSEWMATVDTDSEGRTIVGIYTNKTLACQLQGPMSRAIAATFLAAVERGQPISTPIDLEMHILRNTK